MKKTDPLRKLEKKRQAWIDRTMIIMGMDEDAARQLLSTLRHQSVRINPLKAPAGGLSQVPLPEWVGQPYEWMEGGYKLGAALADVRDDVRVTNGELFIQNAASWLPVLALDPQPGDTILDLCAAPGGKTSHIAAITGNQAHITANDNSRPRLAKLRANLKRLNARVERFTLYDATAIVHKLEGEQFDRILIDAPCSGEGLMNLASDKDFATWSVAHIKRLQQLQKRILGQAWQLLKPGGTLIYSTCTMAPEENEAVVDYLLRSRKDASILPIETSKAHSLQLGALSNRVPTLRSWNGKVFDPSIQNCLRLKPSENVEAFFVCKLQKCSTS